MAKRPDHVLVDVHNCLHCDDQCRRLLESGQVEQARQALAQRVVRDRGRTMLFVDGGPGGRATTELRDGQRWYYSGLGSADDDIVRFLDHHPKQRHLVVSNDRELRGRARARGALLLHCEQWWQRQATSASAESEDRGPPPVSELAMWAEMFGVDDDQQLSQGIQQWLLSFRTIFAGALQQQVIRLKVGRSMAIANRCGIPSP